MQPSTEQLKQAFDRTDLLLIGISFDQAVNTAAVKTCLVRLATNSAKHSKKIEPVIKRASKPAREYWWLKD